MNDFTKEELESLISTIKSLRVYTGINNWDEELEIKIQSMIDKYYDQDCPEIHDINSINLCSKCRKHHE
jgi:hypothetical protein